MDDYLLLGIDIGASSSKGVLVALDGRLVVAMLPPMIIFLLLGRYVVRGLTFGAVKG